MYLTEKSCYYHAPDCLLGMITGCTSTKGHKLEYGRTKKSIKG